MTREEVVAEARAWIGTPYRLGGRVKGAGADCSTLLLEVYRACGFILDDDGFAFGQDWFLHTSEPEYLKRALKLARQVSEGICYRSTVAEPGNLVLSKAVGSRLHNHGGIVTAWPRLIHAVQPIVEETDIRHALWQNREIVILDPWKAIADAQDAPQSTIGDLIG